MLDLVLVGGGLANGLLAWRLVMTRPDVSFVVLEAGRALGGNHTWTFHGTDVTKAQLEWLWVLVSKSWHAHDVAFSREQPRRIGGGHHAITSADLHWKLMERLGERVRLKTRVAEVGATHVVLEDGERIEARAVLDGRGTPPAVPGAWQQSLGLEVELEAPHALDAPLLIDARFEDEADELRWISVFPWDARRVLARDTVVRASAGAPDLALHRARLETWCSAQGLRVKSVLREEPAVLPLPLSGAAPTLTSPRVGVAAGLFHAATGSSLPMAVDVAEALPALPELTAPALTAWLQQHAARHWAQQAFARASNRLLLGAPAPARRRVLEALYAQPEDTLARFHAGTTDLFDRLAIARRWAGVVPTFTALRAALG